MLVNGGGKSGIPSIMTSFQEATQQTPTYKISYSPERVFCTINFSTIVSKATEKPKNYIESSQKSSQKILELIAANTSISTQEIADTIGISRRAIAKAIAKLQAEGFLRRVGPDKGGHWEIIPFDQ